MKNLKNKTQYIIGIVLGVLIIIIIASLRIQVVIGNIGAQIGRQDSTRGANEINYTATVTEEATERKSYS